VRNAGIFSSAARSPRRSLSFIDAGRAVRLIGWGERGYWDLVAARVPSNVLAEVTVGPLILAWAAVGVSGLRRTPLARHAEAVALLLGLLAACLLAFDVPPTYTQLGPALFYAPLPFLLWAAVRHGPSGIATATAVMTVATIWGAVNGLGPFTGSTPQDTAREMQLFLTAVSVPLLLLAVALEERTRAERDAREQRLQLTHLSRVVLGELSGGIR
jgi:integral membrane sensor domain MASE1